MHELYTHVAQRSFDVVVERKAQDWWHPSLDAVMTALAIDPLEAQDFSTGDRRKKPAMELPAHDLRSFADSGRLLDALKTVAQWVERRQPWTEEPEDEVPDMTSEALGEALGDVLDFNQKLGAWSACKVLRWIVDRVSATRDQKRLCLSVADTVEGWVRSGVIDRVLLLNQRNAAEGLWSAAGSIGFVGAASVNCADTASSDVVSASRGAAYTVTWTISAVINNGDSPLTAIEKLRDVIADACRSFPVRSFEQQQFSSAEPRRNPTSSQAMHPVYSYVSARSAKASFERSRAPKLEELLRALATPPENAQDARREKEWPPHGLADVLASDKSAVVMVTIAQWIKDQGARMALAPLWKLEPKLAVWCVCAVVRRALAEASVSGKPVRLIDAVEGFVRGKQSLGLMRELQQDVADMRERPELSEPQKNAMFSAEAVAAAVLNSDFSELKNGFDHAIAVLTDQRFFKKTGGKASGSWEPREWMRQRNARREAIRIVMADACMRFPYSAINAQQSARPARRNPSDTQSLRGMIEGRRGNDFSRFYGMSQEQVREHGDVVKMGRASRWTGPQGELVLIDPDYVRATDGNHFDPRKLAAVSDAVRSGQNPTFAVGYGTVLLIDEGLVREDQESFASGELMSDRPLEKRDVGKLLYRVRDGNHRVFGALLGGENKVWMKLDKNMLQDMREYRAAKREKALAEYKERYGQRHAKLMALLDTKLMKD